MPSQKLTLIAENGRSTAIGPDCVVGRTLVDQMLGIPDPTISREHFQLRAKGRKIWIRDGSKAGVPSLLGTHLDGRRLPANQWEPLGQSHSLRLGRTHLKLQIDVGVRNEFDLMISYSRKDEVAVKSIFLQLRELGLNPWMDQTGNRPAAHYLQDIEKILDECSAAAVFWGGDHMGNTQAAEVEVIKARHIEKSIRFLFLVVLPGSTDPDFGALLTIIDYYDLRKAGELDRLVRNLDKALLIGDGEE